MSIIRKIFLVIVILKATSATCTKNLQVPPTVVHKKVCNETKEKVTNKVPVTELCSFNYVEWQDFQFNNVEDFSCNLHGTAGNYLPHKTVPNKILVYKDWVFLTIPRTIGVYSTLNYFHLSDIIVGNLSCPTLSCFPNCEINTLALPGACSISNYYLTNVVDIKIDKCGVLWVLDIGHYLGESGLYLANLVQDPQICRYNLSVTNADPLINCWTFPENYFNIQNVLGFSDLIVNCQGEFDNCFVYVFNTLEAFLVVFSLKTEESWVYNGVKLGPEPDDTKFEVVLPDHTQYSYVALTGAAGVLDGASLHFCRRPGKDLYSIPQHVLNTFVNTKVPHFDYNIKKVGSLNAKGQLNSMVASDDVVFGAEEQNHAIVCYNKKNYVSPDDVQFIVQDRLQYPFISDVCLTSDKPGEKQVFFLSNNQLDIAKSGLNKNEKNFRIFYFNVKDAQTLYPDCKGYYKDLERPAPCNKTHYDLYHMLHNLHATPTCHKKEVRPLYHGPYPYPYGHKLLKK